VPFSQLSAQPKGLALASHFIVTFGQRKNAPFSMRSTEFGMYTDDNPLQFQKACSRMLVIELGMITSVRLHPKNAAVSMFVTKPGMVYEPVMPCGNSNKDVLSLLRSTPFDVAYTVFPFDTFIFVNLRHRLKALPPMLVTELGIVTEVSPLQL
jgi:hypothetical protein